MTDTTDKHFCPRREEAPHIAKAFPEGDVWDDRDGYRACTYCGSMHPDDLFEAIERGDKLGPTDKSYKIYVDLPHKNPDSVRVVGSANFKPGDSYKNWNDLTPEEKEIAKGYDPTDGQERFIQFGTNGAINHAKFYFQHLSPEQRTKFVQLLNDKKMNIGYPGYFYSLPYFVKKEL